jgi:hypothetical protein
LKSTSGGPSRECCSAEKEFSIGNWIRAGMGAWKRKFLVVVTNERAGGKKGAQGAQIWRRRALVYGRVRLDEGKEEVKFVAQTSSAIKYKFTVLLILFQVRTCAKLLFLSPPTKDSKTKSSPFRILIPRRSFIVSEQGQWYFRGSEQWIMWLRSPTENRLTVRLDFQMRTRARTINNPKVLRLTSNY